MRKNTVEVVLRRKLGNKSPGDKVLVDSDKAALLKRMGYLDAPVEPVESLDDVVRVPSVFSVKKSKKNAEVADG